jgi:hypothetical protein
MATLGALVSNDLVASNTITKSITTTTENGLIIFVITDSGTTANAITVTVDGASATQIGSNVGITGTSNPSIAAFIFIGLSANTHSVIATCALNRDTGIIIQAINNLKQTTTPDSSNSGTVSSGTTQTLSTTTIVNNAYLLYGVYTGGGTLTAGTGSTLLTPASKTYALFDGGVAASPGSHSMSSTAGTTSPFAGIIISLNIIQTITVSDSTAMANLDTVTIVYQAFITVTDSLAMGALDFIHTAYGWLNQAKSVLGSWINNKKS